MSLCIAQAAFAQTSGTGSVSGTGSTMETGSGGARTVEDILKGIRALAPERNPKKLKDILVAEQKQKAWDNESTQARLRLADHRRDCREAIRKSNRDQLMDRLSSCYRSDLLQDINILRKQQQYFSAIPMLSPAVRMSASGAILELTDAEMTIVNAIDTGLFTTSAGLEQAKKNLRATYRVPYWTALNHLHADQNLTWIIFMVKQLEERIVPTGSGATISPRVETAAGCLETAAKKLIEARGATDYKAASALLHEAKITLDSCRKTLRTIAQSEQAAAEKLSEAKSQQ